MGESDDPEAPNSISRESRRDLSVGNRGLGGLSGQAEWEAPARACTGVCGGGWACRPGVPEESGLALRVEL